LLAGELSAVVLALAFLNRLTWLTRFSQTFYDDVVTFCQQNGLSLTEIAMLVTLSLGFVLFDLFAAYAEDDVVDTLSYIIFMFVCATILFLAFGYDIMCYFLVSGVSSGDLSLRTIGTDLVNNFLCLLRVIFCWLRYVFYDLQTEFVDFTFHYTDPAVEGTWAEMFFAAQSVWTDGNLERGTYSLWTAVWMSMWALGGIFLDITYMLIQLLIGFFKLAIAFFLLWLIVDLFLMRPFSHSESRGVLWRRQRWIGSHRMY